MKNKKFWLLLFPIVGLLDSAYLYYESLFQKLVPCPIHGFMVDCGKVLSSSYAHIFSIPLSLLGVFHYFLLIAWGTLFFSTNRRIFGIFFLLESAIGFVFSGYLVFIMLGVLQAICLYCLLSAITSFSLAILAYWFLSAERVALSAVITHSVYRFVRPLLFLTPSEPIHQVMTKIGNFLGSHAISRGLYRCFYRVEDPALKQTIAHIPFANPIGLAAGFDYNAELPLFLPVLGFGSSTVGTITNKAYEGNYPPRLGRLIRSKSLMVNKGFKNNGIKQIVKRMKKMPITTPVGMSIGQTNTLDLKTQKDAVSDIVEAFVTVEKAKLKLAYYELNISCPNLKGNISFYPPKHLYELIAAVTKLNLSHPLFIKMPIEKTDEEVRTMLDVIVKFPVAGVIFGNLQKNREDASLNKKEVAKYSVGYYSGKPTEKRSNELIRLAYREQGKKLVIVGCGGIFNGKDAYKKIRLGASLVQLITGLIFEGPQLAAQINIELLDLLKKDGFKNISEAVGVDA
ncbi:quinone-dependent dihydroorotate dehydrogenase [Candidatus Roizmanbacteria bacterium]|nr:quinone-dependent dihydroorotate dehydrogenase [Candidatus Roizmanbacteria bacterium]